MTDITVSPSHARIPVFRTAYDAYRLGFRAVFSSGKMFRFFIYGSVLTIAVFGAVKYFRMSSAPYLLTRGSPLEVETNFAIELLLSAISFAAAATVQASLGIATMRHILLCEIPSGTYFHLMASRDGRRFCPLTSLVYFLFLLASLAFIPLALAHGINPLHRGNIMDEVMVSPSFILEIVLVWSLAGVLACVASATLSPRFPALACGRTLPKGSSGGLWRLACMHAIALVPLAATAVAVYYAGIVFYLFRHWAAVEESLSASNLGNLTYDITRSVPFIIAYGFILVVGMIAYVVTAAGAARAYQIRVERGLSGVAEVFS